MKNLYLIEDIQHQLEWLHREKQITDWGWRQIISLLSYLHKSVIVPESVFLEMEEKAEEHEEELSKMDYEQYVRAFRDGYETARRDWPRNRFKNPEEITELLLDLAEPQTPTNDEHIIP